MFPTRRFSFNERDEAARKVFEHAHQLQVTMSRGRGSCGPILFYQLEGGFDGQSDAELLGTAKELLDAFQQLGRIPAKADDDDDDDDCEAHE